MTNLSTIKSWIELITSYDSSNVVYEYGGGPEPTGDFISFGEPIADEELVVPFSSTAVDAGDLTITHYVQTRVTVPISVYAIDGAAKLRDLALSVKGYAPRKLLTDGGLVFQSKSAVRNLTSYNDTSPEYRFQADFDFISYDEWVENDWELQQLAFDGVLESDTDELVSSYELDFTE